MLATPKTLLQAGPKTLEKILELRLSQEDKAAAKVRALAAHGHERWNETLQRLGDQHPAVISYVATERRTLQIYAECVRRYGSDAVTYRSMWPTFLRVRAVR